MPKFISNGWGGKPTTIYNEEESKEFTHPTTSEEYKTMHSTGGHQHRLLRKSPWVERAESNTLPAKELKP